MQIIITSDLDKVDPKILARHVHDARVAIMGGVPFVGGGVVSGVGVKICARKEVATITYKEVKE